MRAGAFTLAVLLAWPAASVAQQRDRSAAAISEYPLTGDEGQRVPNHSVKLLGPIDRLPGVVTVGNPNGKTTLVEFYDLNCPYCRAASADIADLIDLDPQLRLVLVPYPVLGIPSIGAARVELAVANSERRSSFTIFTARSMRSAAPPTDPARSKSPVGWVSTRPP